MNEQQQYERSATQDMEKKGKEEKIQKKSRVCKLLFEGVMKRCRKMCIKDVIHNVFGAKEVTKDNIEGECWEAIVQTSLIVVLDERYEFPGIGFAQLVMPYSRGFVINCALSASSKYAEEDAFKKILERIEPLVLCTSPPSFHNGNNNNVILSNEFDSQNIC